MLEALDAEGKRNGMDLEILGVVLVLHGEDHGTLEALDVGVNHLRGQPPERLFDVHPCHEVEQEGASLWRPGGAVRTGTTTWGRRSEASCGHCRRSEGDSEVMRGSHRGDKDCGADESTTGGHHGHEK
jgi:hypothetical protein